MNMRDLLGGWGRADGASAVGASHVPRPSCFVLIALLCCLSRGTHAFAETANRIAAFVNDEIITEADVLSYANALLEEQPGQTEIDPRSLETQLVVLHRLIEQRLILQEAKKAGISVSPEEVLDRLKVLRNRFDSDEEFEQSLADSHLTKEQLKEKLREQLTVQGLIDAKIRATIVVSPQEVAKELAAHPQLGQGGDRVRASHILVRVSDTRPEAAARARIDEVCRQLEGGADFATLAKRYSEDSNAEDGGSIGWVAQGDLMPELDAALFNLSAGRFSQPIQSRLGFHVIRMEERRSAASLSDAEAHRAVYQRLYQQKFQTAFTQWLMQVKQRAYIEIPQEPS